MSNESGFDYKDKSAPKLRDEFKQKFSVNIKGKDAIKLEGLTAFAHIKGIKSMETTIVQYPSDQNQWTAICQTTVVGFDYSPAEDKVVEVTYTDIGDANMNNCGKMVAASYIRMASTRSQARALRKYTNIDMVCSSELGEALEEPQEEGISYEQLTKVKSLLKEKGLAQDSFGKILFQLFQHQNYMQLTKSQGNTLIETLTNLPTPNNGQ